MRNNFAFLTSQLIIPVFELGNGILNSAILETICITQPILFHPLFFNHYPIIKLDREETDKLQFDVENFSLLSPPRTCSSNSQLTI